MAQFKFLKTPGYMIYFIYSVCTLMEKNTLMI